MGEVDRDGAGKNERRRDLSLGVSDSFSRQLQEINQTTQLIGKNLGAFDEIARVAQQQLTVDSGITRMLTEFATIRSQVLTDLQRTLSPSVLNQANQAAALGRAFQASFPSDLAKMLNVQASEVLRTAARAQEVESIQRSIAELVKSFVVPEAVWPTIEGVRKQVAPFIEEIQEADAERLASLVEENLLSDATTETPQPASKGRSTRKKKSIALTKKQTFLLAWLVVIIMSLPAFRDYRDKDQQKAADASFNFAISLAAGLTVWGLAEPPPE